MNVSKLLTVLIVVAVAAMVVKGVGGKLGFLIGITSLVLTTLWFITKTTPLLQYVTSLDTVSGDVIVTITKVIGIAYLSDFTSSLCKDIGESTIAIGAETVGKAEIIMLGFPLFKRMINICAELMG